MDTIDTKNWEDQLQRDGARITKTRKAIMHVLASSAYPLTPLEIFNLAKEESSNLGLVTVYRTIERMESLGILDRIHGHGQCQSVFRAAKGHRHLLICTGCGKTIYFDGLPAEKIFQEIGQKNGFRINGHMLQLFGLCNLCQKKEINDAKI